MTTANGIATFDDGLEHLKKIIGLANHKGGKVLAGATHAGHGWRLLLLADGVEYQSIVYEADAKEAIRQIAALAEHTLFEVQLLDALREIDWTGGPHGFEHPVAVKK